MSSRLPTTSGTWIGRHADLLRYLLVGLLNTGVDFALYTTFAVLLGITPLIANVMSTSITLCFSYLLNRAFVFRTERSVGGTIVQFVGVTLFSAFVIQSGVIFVVIHAGSRLIPSLDAAVLKEVAKICAMGTGMVSNYLGYRWLFARRGH